MYKVSGLQPVIPIIKEKFMPDGLHPSNAGAKRIAERLYGFLSAL
ncbi:MAG: SGNH/GDSL hydrolase family protein [Clostridia bacterium]|nr:SGNH/GDSL hydrolase family protein [Clostridia bacterium]